MEGTRNCNIKWNKPDWERQVLHFLSHMYNLDLKKKKRGGHSVKRGGKTASGNQQQVNRRWIWSKYVWKRLTKTVNIVQWRGRGQQKG
jgi:hypothetical protein